MALRRDDTAVLDMPMGLTVSIVVGTVCLIAVVGFIMDPCIIPKDVVVTIDPYSAQLSTSNNVTVWVSTQEGRPMEGAHVIVKGAGDVVAGDTNATGGVILVVHGVMPVGRHEVFLDVIVDPQGCYKRYEQDDIIRLTS